MGGGRAAESPEGPEAAAQGGVTGSKQSFSEVQAYGVRGTRGQNSPPWLRVLPSLRTMITSQGPLRSVPPTAVCLRVSQPLALSLLDTFLPTCSPQSWPLGTTPSASRKPTLTNPIPLGPLVAVARSPLPGA